MFVPSPRLTDTRLKKNSAYLVQVWSKQEEEKEEEEEETTCKVSSESSEIFLFLFLKIHLDFSQ